MRVKILLFVLFLLFASKSVAQTYYVSPSGSGTTCSYSSPCSLNTGLTHTGTGITIRLLAGIYRQQLRLVDATGGTLADPTIIEGPPDFSAIIDPSPSLSWSLYSGSGSTAVYRTAIGITPTFLMATSVPVWPAVDLAHLTAGTWAYDSGYLYAEPGGTLPDLNTVYANNEVSGDDTVHSIYLWDMNHIILRYLVARGAAWHGIYSAHTGGDIRIQNVRVEGVANGGIVLEGSNGGSSISSCNIKYSVMRNYPRGKMVGGGWSSAINVKEASVTVQDSIVDQAGGEGILFYTPDATDGFILRNSVTDAYSAGFYIDNTPGPTKMDSNYALCHTPDDSKIYSGTSDQNKARELMRAVGFETGDEYGSGVTAHFSHLTATNNVFWNCQAIRHNAEVSSSGWKYVTFVNNTVVLDSSSLQSGETHNGYYGAVFPSKSDNSNSEFSYNVFATSGTSPTVWYADNYGNNATNAFVGITWQYNLWYGDSFYQGTSAVNHSTWAGIGNTHTTGDIVSAPVFLSGVTGYMTGVLGPTSSGYGIVGALGSQTCN